MSSGTELEHSVPEDITSAEGSGANRGQPDRWNVKSATTWQISDVGEQSKVTWRQSV